MKRPLALGLVLLLGVRSMVFAAADPAPAKSDQERPGSGRAASSLKPIGVMNSEDGKRPHREFYHEGVQLTSNQQIRDVIAPLGDPEADGLIRSAQGKEGLATGLDIIGGGFALSGLIYEVAAQGTTTTTYLPYGPPLSNVTPADPAPAIVLAGVGVLFAVFGMVAEGDGANYRDKAVARYNSLVSPGDVSMGQGGLPAEVLGTGLDYPVRVAWRF